MKIYIDTADIDQIKEAYSWGIVSGITTNPSLIKQSADKYEIKNMEDYINKIFSEAKVGNPISLEVTALTENEMYNQAKQLYSLFSSTPSKAKPLIKVPISPASKNIANYDGLKVIKRLKEEGVYTNATLVMTPEQALLAAKSGATYVSPFVGRIDDDLRKKLGWKLVKEKPKEEEFTKSSYYPAKGITHFGERLVHDNGIVSGVHLAKTIVDIFKTYKIKTKVIAASIRNTRQVREVAQAGVHIATIPFSVLEEMVTHHKTAEGVKKFSDDIIPEYESLFESL